MDVCVFEEAHFYFYSVLLHHLQLPVSTMREKRPAQEVEDMETWRDSEAGRQYEMVLCSPHLCRGMKF